MRSVRPSIIETTRTSATSVRRPEIQPTSVETLRVLGAGRAAIAREVIVETQDFGELNVVEKVFAPGKLTRVIYQTAFASPFAYQANRDAILTSYYRRQYASLVLSVAGLPIDVALPAYVRFDAKAGGWVLAAQRIHGRRLQPSDRAAKRPAEIQEMVAHMRDAVAVLAEAGLFASGWQIDPAALVSTANLLPHGGRYTIVDLESGIPAVLVPRYVLGGLRRGQVPPFDDIDEDRLTAWTLRNAERADALAANSNLPSWLELPPCRHVAQRLTRHARRWKASELAPLRRCATVFSAKQTSRRPRSLRLYRVACRSHYQRSGLISRQHPSPTAAARWMWWATRIPGGIGRSLGRLATDPDVREKAIRLFLDRKFRRSFFDARHRERVESLRRAARLAEDANPGPLASHVHQTLTHVLPVAVHRFVFDPARRAECLADGTLLLTSPRFQKAVGQALLLKTLRRRSEAGTLSPAAASELSRQAVSPQVVLCAQGFGSHLIAKAISPLLTPAKYGGVAWFLAGGSWWTLLPLAALPVVRTLLTLGIWWQYRGQHVRLGTALTLGAIPSLGSLAFPYQLHRTHPGLSGCLLVEFASGLGERIPIYGGRDSRTQWWLIEAARRLIRHQTQSGTRNVEAPSKLMDTSPSADPVEMPQTHRTVPRIARTRLGRWWQRTRSERHSAWETTRRREQNELAESLRSVGIPSARPNDGESGGPSQKAA